MPRRRRAVPAVALMVGIGAAFAVPVDGATPAPPAVLSVASGTAAAISTPTIPSDKPAPDPFPIRRLFVPSDRLAAVLGQAVAREPLVRLSRAEFESKVRAAAAAGRVPPPRLVEARYRATLSAAGLTGTAVWTVTASAPGLLPLDPLGVAVSNARTADGTHVAVFRGEAGGRTGVSALVDRAGDGAVSLDWSARGVEEPAADRFDLLFPPAPVATLDLDLPADRTPAVASADQLLTGPFPGPTPDRRTWRVAAGGQSRIDLAVRRPGAPGEPAAVVRANRAVRFDLSPELAEFVAEFDVEPVRGRPTELVFEADPGVQVTTVTGPGQPVWRTEPPAAGGPTRVRVAVGTDSGQVRLSGFAPLPPAAEWACPRVRLVGGLPGADRIEVHVDPDLKFLGCEPGDYRVATAAADRGYRVVLTGTLLGPGGGPDVRRPPVIRFRAAGAEFSVTADLLWSVAADRTDLSAAYRVRVVRGPLAWLPVRVPHGFAVSTVTTSPDDAGMTWSVSGETLRVEPGRPLSTGAAVDVRVTFRGPSPLPAFDPAAPSTDATIPFPQADVIGATDQDGVFKVLASAEVEAWPSRPPPGPDAGWSYRFRGRPPDGVLTVGRRPAPITADRDTAVTLDGPAVTAATTVTVRAAGLGAVTVWTPRAPGVRWAVRADRGDVRRLDGGAVLPWAVLLASPSAWAAGVGAAAGAELRGDVWHVRLQAPATGVATVVAVASVPAPGDRSTAVAIPLPSVFGVPPTAPRVTLTPAAAADYDAVPKSTTGGLGALFLQPRGRHHSAGESPSQWMFAAVGLATRIEADGGRSCSFTGRVMAAQAATVPADLPADAEVESVTVAGRFVDTSVRAGGAAPGRLTLPLPAAGPEGILFAVRYRIPAPPGSDAILPTPVVRLESRPPGLPGAPAVACQWESDPAFVLWPAFDVAAQPIAGGSEVVVVRAAGLRAAGTAAAALMVGFAVAGWAGGRRHRVAFAGLVGLVGVAHWLAPAGASPLTHPPLVAGMAAFAGLSLWTRRRSAGEGRSSARRTGGLSARPRMPSTATLGPAIVAVVCLAGSTVAEAPEPVTVYLTPSARPTPDDLAVLAPKGVLDRLDGFARSPVPGVLLTAADYDGEATGDGPATVTATFRVDCTRPGDLTLDLPLGGVRLERVDVDGKPASPDAPAPDRYALTVRGVGRHEVTARFAVPVVAVGADREVRFAAPDVPNCRVRFTAPPRTRGVDVPTRVGVQVGTAVGDRPRVDADHGPGGRGVGVRWRAGAGGGGAATVTADEACVWDLTEVGAAATVAVVYRVEGGTVSRVAVEIPDGFEPGRPALRPVDGAAAAPGLRDWRVGPGPAGWRTLDVGLQAPADGRFAVAFRLTPVRPGSERPTLRAARAVGVARSDGLCAVRASGVVVADAGRAGVIDYPAAELVRRFAAVPDLGLDRAPVDRVFQRVPGQDAELRPTLRPAGEAAAGAADVTWTVGGVVRGDGAVTVTRPTGVAVVEFDLPLTVRVDEVRGPDLSGWGRAGTRVQAWLRRPAREATVRWTGGLEGLAVDGATVGLPVPRVVADTVEPVGFRVESADGWAITPDGLTTVPPAVDPSAAPPRVTMHAPEPPTAANIRETFESDGRYRATVTMPPADRPRAVTVTLAGGDEVDLRVSDAARVHGPVRTGHSSTWDVTATATAVPLELVLSARAATPGVRPTPTLVCGGRVVPWADRRQPAAGEGPGVGHPPGPLPRPPASNTSPPAEPVGHGSSEPDDLGRDVVRWFGVTAWLLGLTAVTAVTVRADGRGWPERLVGCGLLGAVAVGVWTPAGGAFLAAAAVGVAVRGWRLKRRVVGPVTW